MKKQADSSANLPAGGGMTRIKTVPSMTEKTLELLYFGGGYGGMKGDTNSLANIVQTPSRQGRLASE